MKGGKKGGFVPITNHDVIIRADVDEESGIKQTHEMYFVFYMRVVTRELYLFTSQSANTPKLQDKKS